MKVALAVAMLTLCSVGLTQASSVGNLGYQTHEADQSQDTTNCLYNDSHFHIQDFKAEGPDSTPSPG